MNFTRAQENVNAAFFSSGLYRGTRGIDVCADATGEASDHGPTNSSGDFTDRFEVSPAGDGKAGLDDIDP